MNFDELCKGYKIRVEEGHSRNEAEAWRYLEVVGRKGWLYPYSEELIAVRFNFARTGRLQIKKTDWRVVQDADDGIVALAPLNQLPQCLSSILARRRRQVSEQERERLKKMGFKKSKG